MPLGELAIKNPYDHYKEKMYWAPAIKVWSNGIPLKSDTYSSCKNECRYCYAREFRKSTLSRIGMKTSPNVGRVLNLKLIEKFFQKAYNHEDEKNPFMNWCIRQKYFIELGTMGETFQEADWDMRITWNFFELMSEYRMPIFLNTKLNLVSKTQEYRDLLIRHKAPIIICCSLSTVDDKTSLKYEPMSPLPSANLAALKELSQYDHISCIIYISPFIPGVTDVNYENFMDKIMDAGCVSAHLRDFYIQGTIFNTSFWDKYKEENKANLTAFPGGQHVSYEMRREYLEKMTAYAQKRDPNFIVTGMKKQWFELPPFHGKMNYDILPQPFKDGITDYTAIPLMRKVRERADIPQLLKWNELGHKGIDLPEKIHSNEGEINTLMEGVCNCNTSDVNYQVSGKDWLSGGLWNGWNPEKPGGFFGELSYIFPVKEDGKYKKDEDDNFIYAYLPKDKWHLVKENEQNILFAPTDVRKMGKMKEASVEWGLAKDFYTPVREPGTADKFDESLVIQT